MANFIIVIKHINGYAAHGSNALACRDDGNFGLQDRDEALRYITHRAQNHMDGARFALQRYMYDVRPGTSEKIGCDLNLNKVRIFSSIDELDENTSLTTVMNILLKSFPNSMYYYLDCTNEYKWFRWFKNMGSRKFRRYEIPEFV